MSLDNLPATPPTRWRRTLVTTGLFGAVVLWAYLPTLGVMAERWTHDPRYSHGPLVPAFAAYLLWLRRGMLGPVSARAGWWGTALVALGAALRAFGAFYYVEWFDAVSLLPVLAGLVVLARGPGALRWAWPAVAFLIFMIPLPYRAEMSMGAPLQRVATQMSTYALQTFGLPAVAEGNIILIDRTRIGVVEACNGIGMMFMFAAFAVAAVFVVNRPKLDRALILLSAIPIALLANVTRITATGLLHATAGGKVADVVYHDLAGWLMMPLALAVLWAELWLLSRLFLEPNPADVVPAGLGFGTAAAALPGGRGPGNRRPPAR